MPIATGQQILAADVNALMTRVRKTANETVNNNNVPQDDDELFSPLLANEVWIGRALILFTSDAINCDIRFNFTVPAGCTIYMSAVYRDPATGVITLISGLGTAGSTYQGAGAAMVLAILDFTVINGANAGNLQLQWAQLTAKVANTTVYANSCLHLTKLA